METLRRCANCSLQRGRRPASMTCCSVLASPPSPYRPRLKGIDFQSRRLLGSSVTWFLRLRRRHNRLNVKTMTKNRERNPQRNKERNKVSPIDRSHTRECDVRSWISHKPAERLEGVGSSKPEHSELHVEVDDVEQVHTKTNATTRLLRRELYIHISTFSCSHNDECYDTPAVPLTLHSHQYILLFTQRRMLRHACCTANSTFTSVHSLVHTTTNDTTCLLRGELYIHINTFSGSHNDECYDTPAVSLTLHSHQHILLFFLLFVVSCHYFFCAEHILVYFH